MHTFHRKHIQDEILRTSETISTALCTYTTKRE